MWPWKGGVREAVVITSGVTHNMRMSAAAVCGSVGAGDASVTCNVEGLDLYKGVGARTIEADKDDVRGVGEARMALHESTDGVIVARPTVHMDAVGAEHSGTDAAEG